MIVIDVGHSAKDKGAHNTKLNLSEWDFNSQVADIIDSVSWFKSQIVWRTDGITKLVNDINKVKPQFVLSLHCNAAADPRATGTECLYWWSSDRSRKAAQIFQANLVTALGLKDRGIKPITEKDRGGAQLKGVNAPIVLIEPFFLSNIRDYETVKERYHLFTDALLKSCDEVLSTIVK